MTIGTWDIVAMVCCVVTALPALLVLTILVGVGRNKAADLRSDMRERFARGAGAR